MLKKIIFEILGIFRNPVNFGDISVNFGDNVKTLFDKKYELSYLKEKQMIID